MMKNKIIVFIFAVVLVLTGIININSVNAATRVEFNRCSYPLNRSLMLPYILNRIDPSPESGDHFTAYSANGHIVYCVELGVHLVNETDSLTGPDYTTYNPNLASSYLDRVLVYGLNGADTASEPACSVDRAATQLMVWIAAKADEDKTVNWNNITESLLIQMTNSAIGSKAYDIKQLTMNHKVVPSFTKATEEAAKQAEDRVELKYSETNRNFSNTITDTNGVLSSWTKGANPSKITATVSGNNLTITSKDDSQTTPISFSKIFKAASTGYVRDGGSVQRTKYISPNNETVKAYVGYKYQEIGKGIVSIHKIDKYTGKNMQGAKFGIFSDDKCTVKAKDYLGNELPEKTTDKNGFVSWDNLYYPLEEGGKRTYYVKETEVIDGYSIDNEQMEMLGAGENACVPVEVNAEVVSSEEAEEVEYEKNDVEVQAIYNIPYGNITILKQDSETGAVIEGVEFRLLKYNKDRDPATDIYGNEVENAVTGENGVAEFENIPYGDYILEEVKANGSYKILEEPIEFTLDANTDALKYRDQGTEAIPDEDEVLLPLETYRLGDPTDDGVIDSNDLTIIVGILEGTIAEEDITKVYRYASDVDQDGSITEKDKELMSSYLGGDPNAFEALKEIEYPGQFQKRVTIVVTNVPIDMKVSKQAITNEKELKGATITIRNSEGEVFIKYKSTGKPYEFYIPVGDYKLIEEISPSGYQNLKTEVEFRVGTDGNIKLLSAKSNMYKLIKSQEEDDNDLDHLIIYNNLKRVVVPNTGSTIAFISIIGGIALIGGGGYAIYRRYKTS